jgi:hypothetical protein
MRKFIVSLAFFGVVLFAARTGVDSHAYIEHVKYLASPELRGRGTGTPELDKAAQYIARQFKAAGLQPPDGKSYFQEFQVTTNAELGKHNRFRTHSGEHVESLEFKQDFIPFNFSSSGKMSGSVVFAGYGITAREYNYDDYAGLDVKDKIVVLLRHEPQETDEKSVFAGRVFTEHSQFSSKASNAKSHGARGVILVNDVANHPGESDALETFGRTAGPANAGIPFAQVRSDFVQKWVSAAGKDLAEIQQGIDKDLKPRSFAFPETLRFDVDIDLERQVKTVRNVIGYLPGETDEYLVIGAHYDHLGLGEQYSMAPSMAGTPHPGADDNASGTAGVIELARLLAGSPKQKRGILFMTFAGEELGLLGSSFYVNNPRLPLAKAVAMINMDMIGRVRDGKVYVGGAGTGSSFKGVLDQLAPTSGLTLDFSEVAGYGSSDHTSFTTRQVPVLFFFSGLHGDYHKPSDTWDKIDAAQAAVLLQFVADVAGRISESPDRPQYVRVEPPRNAHGGSDSSGSGSGGSGYGPDFGSIPDFAEVPNGVKFADVRKGSPADEAGLRGGDILVEFDGKPIQNLYDFTYALRAKRPGEEVTVKVLRNGSPMEAKVKLRARR